MAIDQTGATMTGMINQKPNVPKAPDMSALKAPLENKPMNEKKIVQAPVKEEQNLEQVLLEKYPGLKELTAEDNAVLDNVLSPSVKGVLGKVFPELSNILNNFGTNEPNVVLPLSAISKFATQKYGIADPEEAVNNFLTEVTSTMDQQMETNNVPPSQANESNGLMTSPQNMETV